MYKNIYLATTRKHADRQTAFQLYIVDYIISAPIVSYSGITYCNKDLLLNYLFSLYIANSYKLATNDENSK